MTSQQQFQLASDFMPAGDQPQAIAALLDGLRNGLARQTLLGVTGSGKTFTIANVIQALQRALKQSGHRVSMVAPSTEQVPPAWV